MSPLRSSRGRRKEKTGGREESPSQQTRPTTLSPQPPPQPPPQPKRRTLRCRLWEEEEKRESSIILRC